MVWKAVRSAVIPPATCGQRAAPQEDDGSEQPPKPDRIMRTVQVMTTSPDARAYAPPSASAPVTAPRGRRGRAPPSPRPRARARGAGSGWGGAAGS